MTDRDDLFAKSDATYPRRIDRIAKDAHGLFLMTVAGGFVAFVLWAALTELDRVTRGEGRVVPVTQNQTVQHLEGGIVTEILVKEGDLVERGQPLLKLTNSLWQAELAQARIELKAKRVRSARLQAEVDGSEAVRYPDDALKELPAIVEAETSLFRSRKASFDEQVRIVADQVRQKELELAELRGRWTNIQRERDLMRERVNSLRRLNQVGAVSRNDLLEAEIGLSQLETRLSDLVHDIPRTEAALSETQRKKTDVTLRFRADAEKEKNETEVAIAKTEEQITALSDRSRRSEVTAPISGIVNKLFVSTIGGVVRPAEPLVQLVPADGSLAVEAKITPSDRGRVWPGLPAVVKISAYEYAIHGGLSGKVTEVSPDALTDEQGRPYFRVRLEANAASFGPEKPVLPGMMADVDILSGRHTVMSYILKPLSVMRDNALRQ